MPASRRSPLFPDLRLSPRGTWTLLAGVAFLGAGVLATSWTLVLWGQVIVACLAPARLLVEPEARALRAGEVQARPEVGAQVTAAVGHPLQLEVRVDGPVARWLVEVVGSPSLSLASRTVEVEAPGREGVEVRPCAAGHAFLHGLRLSRSPWPGLFELQGWFPSERSLPVLPAGATAGGSTGPVARQEDDLAACHLVRRRGLGSEFREIRDHRPGDPFRAIAWKASARRGRLLVREFESEVRLTLVALLDVSPSMRRGPLGETPLDGAVEALARLSRLLLAAGDRVGLVTFDRRPVLRVRPAATRGQLQRLVRALLETFHPAAADLAAPDAAGLAERAATHIRYQLGLEVRHPPGGPVDPKRLQAVVRHELQRRRDEVRRLAVPSHALAPDRDEARLRLYCRLAGVATEARPREAPGDLERGLVRALEVAARGSPGPAVLLLLSDLEGLAGLRLRRALQASRGRRDRLLVLAPHPAAAVEDRQGELLDLLSWAEDPAERPAARLLRASGVPVAVPGPADPVPALLTRLLRLRMVAGHA